MVTKLRTYAKVAEDAEKLLELLMDSEDIAIIQACIDLKRSLSNLK